MPTAWVVRPYPHGKYRVKEFLQKNIVAIGWALIGDLSGITTRGAIKKAVTSHYQYSSGQSLGQAAGNIHRFINEIEQGDYVVVPDGRYVFIGNIKSNYQYDNCVDSNAEGYPHQRQVKWAHNKRAILRNNLTGRVYDSLKGQQTVYTTYFEDIDELVKNERHYFSQNGNFDIKSRYLEKLQSGKLSGVNSNTFENAVCSLLAVYFPGMRRLSTTNSKTGDTDLLSELPGGICVRVQVKHFYPDDGEIKKWVVDQLSDSMESGDSGIIVTSGIVSEDAKRYAATISEKHISFIDGEAFTELLFDTLDDLPSDALSTFGLTYDVGFL